MIEPGAMMPDVTLTDMDGQPFALRRMIGTPLVVYFYPRDDTAGCTREALDFSTRMDDFAAIGTGVLGVSRDTPARHRRFADRHGLTVPLASDPEAVAMQAFGIWGERVLYGKRYMGVERSTFLFDRKGVLTEQWRRVKVPGHAEAVLAVAGNQAERERGETA